MASATVLRRCSRRLLPRVSICLLVFGAAQSAFVSENHFRRRARTIATTTSHTAMAEPPMMVVFGRPGSGKTAIAEAAIQMLSTETNSVHCLGLDLDVCVPQWMRDNFAQGIYPTLLQRREFAMGACDYVDAKLEEAPLVTNLSLVTIVSFSFVNTDLRNIYRSRFPHAVWALVDITEAEAADRINQREGHFYKGAPPNEKQVKSSSEEDNSEWNFSPVDFPHILLPGNNSVETNAKQVADELLRRQYQNQLKRALPANYTIPLSRLADGEQKP